MSDLLERVSQGNIRAVARLITQVENDEAMVRAELAALYRLTGNAQIVGITGPPGCGKSTLVNELARRLNDEGKKVGIIAVDPSSPFTGGALLGDRVRMTDITAREGIFVRSMASRGELGGLARATSAVLKVLDAAGYDVILVETVGAGQAEVEIAKVAHSVIVVESPGSGDEVQSIKAGILEIADILVVNKADRPSALRTVRALEMMLHMGETAALRHHGRILVDQEEMRSPGGEQSASWTIPVLQTVATTGQGVEDLVSAIRAHQAYLQESGEWFRRELRNSRREIETLLQERFLTRLKRMVPQETREKLATAVAKRDLDPYAATDQLFELTNRGH